MADHSETWAVIASGPSLTPEQVSHVRALGLKTVAVSDTYQLAPWADILYSANLKWWDWHNGVDFFKGRKGTAEKAAADRYGLEFYKTRFADGFSLEPGLLHTGRNSGYQAVNIAVLEGAKKIYLLGFDHRVESVMEFESYQQICDNRDKIKPHFFGHHPDRIPSNYNLFLQSWGPAAEHAKQLKIEIINCTYGSAIDVFPFGDIFNAT